MAEYIATIRTPQPPEQAFAYMADLRNFEEWDPGVKSATQVVGDEPAAGAAYDVVVDGPGGGMKLRYELVEFDRPNSVTARAANWWLVSLDRIDVAPDGDGSIVTYTAKLDLKGPLRLADVLLQRAFDRIGSRADKGLQRALSGVPV